MLIKSNIDNYSVHFTENFVNEIKKDIEENICFFIIDKNIYEIYKNDLQFLRNEKKYLLCATEQNKTIAESQKVIEFLLKSKFKRNHKIIAIGGGITQDISCFVSSILFRGVKWVFYPTTLLAQCDSCIGSKSSINVGEYKNQVGTFYPPEKILIDTGFLDTLKHEDILSGVGEVIKVHYLDPAGTYKFIINNYENCLNNNNIMLEAIKRSLSIKKSIIEKDEFDKEYRNILNYGHTFGHALEAATKYNLPHGIAVTAGIAMSNFVSLKMGFLEKKLYLDMLQILKKNTSLYKDDLKNMNFDSFFAALQKDKKNIGNKVGFILTSGPGQTFKKQIILENKLKSLIMQSLTCIM